MLWCKMDPLYVTVNQESSSDRFPQWSLNETRELLAIRAELDHTFMETKRNKLLWDVISSKMKDRGYNRSADQCKCKWKNLVARYKGSEAEPDNTRQFPFHEELRMIFAARMQRMLWFEAEGRASGSGKKKAMRSSSEDDDSNGESDEERGSGKKKRKVKSSTAAEKGRGSGASSRSNMQEMLEEFMRQEMEMEMQWRKAVEAREEERRLKETEWRQTMEALERERMLMDRTWREREEQRRIREEARAEKKDALITTLLNKLMHDNP